MNTVFEKYKPRKISFNDWVTINDWVVKIYTITMKNKFNSHSILSNIKKQIPQWLNTIEQSNLPVYKQAFVIVHEAREGVWILLNWWTGGEMIETKVYFSDYQQPKVISDSPYQTNSLLCVWELEVFAHERKSWIQNILENANVPDFDNYKIDVLNGVL